MTAISIDVVALLERAALHLDDEEPAATDGRPVGWQAVTRLQRLASREVLDAALLGCESFDPLRRRVGAAVLGQLGHTAPAFTPVFTEERYRGLSGLLAREVAGPADPTVLADVCYALGHLHDSRAIPSLLALRTHPDADVRSGVVSGLSRYDDPRAISGLIELSSDPADHVRDWATFGLGQMIATDTPAIRAALHARLQDPHHDTRNEAIEGLASRGDESVIPVLIQELGRQIAMPLLDAASAIANPVLCPALIAAAERGLTWEADGQNHDLTGHWRDAMVACGCPLP